MTSRIRVHGGNYRDRDGKLWTFEILYNPAREAGIKEALRHAIRNGGESTYLDSAVTVVVKPKQPT